MRFITDYWKSNDDIKISSKLPRQLFVSYRMQKTRSFYLLRILRKKGAEEKKKNKDISRPTEGLGAVAGHWGVYTKVNFCGCTTPIANVDSLPGILR
jgi:hypothetical protein